MLNLALRIARVVSFILLGLGLILPWYRVPTGVRQGRDGIYSAIYLQPISTLIFKVLLVSCLLAILIYCVRRSVAPLHRLTFVSGAGLFLLVLLTTSFAPLTIQRCAQVAAHAEWLTDQNSSLVLSSGDSLKEQEYSYQPSEPLVAITDVMPRAFAVVPVPDFTSALDLHLSHLLEITMWVGYTAGFCQFAGQGWFCGLFGAILLFASFSRPLRVFTEPSKMSTWRLLGVAFVGGIVLEALWLGLPLMAGTEINRAQRDASLGQFEAAKQHLERAFVLVPSLRFGTDIQFEEGWLDQRTGHSESVQSHLVNAIEEEEEHLSARAWEHYRQLLDPKTPKPVRAEAFRGALRLALRDLNSGSEDKAVVRLGALLAEDPSCIKANYALQLADLRLHRKAELERDVAQFEAVYKTFESLEKIAPIAAAHRRLAELDFETNDAVDLGNQMRAAVKE
ncbi:MAG: hypothetical protein JOZ31_02715 [Verrucomicrobia bacterium]|nr:hypothetical protein [Verrucomicrobiota bacterium]MBV8484472.1 hypothetical protein [Verrucomicrobiota bacterium]